MKQKNALLVAVSSLLAAAAAVFFIKKNQGYQEEKPPKKAPQLHIENPGSQDDFPTAATESEIG